MAQDDPIVDTMAKNNVLGLPSMREKQVKREKKKTGAARVTVVLPLMLFVVNT